MDKAHPVRVDILPREEAFQIPDLIRAKINLLPEGIQQVRVVEIVGLDLQADSFQAMFCLGVDFCREWTALGSSHILL